MDGTTEVHIVWFPSEAAFTRFRGDEARARFAPLLERSGATVELLRLDDVR